MTVILLIAAAIVAVGAVVALAGPYLRPRPAPAVPAYPVCVRARLDLRGRTITVEILNAQACREHALPDFYAGRLAVVDRNHGRRLGLIDVSLSERRALLLAASASDRSGHPFVPHTPVPAIALESAR